MLTGSLWCLLLFSAFSLDGSDVSPFDVGTQSQLFVDQVLVREAKGVSFELVPARKHPANPVLRADKPWEGWRVELYGNVLFDGDEKIYKMWYLGEETQAFPHYAVYYATSTDGIHWEKPLVGTVTSPKYEKHNVVAADIILPCVIKDQSDSEAARRYKMIGWDQKEGAYRTWISPDGLNWTQSGKTPLCRGGDVITGYYDENRKMYVAFPKIGERIRGHDRRVFWLITSKDFENWTEPEIVIAPDLRDDASSLARIEEVRPILDVPDDPALIRTEFYGVGAYPAESCTLAFVWLFTINNNARYGNQEGPGELQLAVSRDLKHWERPFRTPCVPRGKLGEWDCGFFCSQSRALDVGDEVWLYYTGSTYTHGTPCLYRAEGTGRLERHTGAIGLAIWQRDRFVSATAVGEGGLLTTVPLRFSGNRLEVNARTREEGSVCVRIRDAAGEPLDGFELSDSFAGNNLRHVVTWRGQSDVSALAGKPVMLRFEMKHADLYAFAFRD